MAVADLLDHLEIEHGALVEALRFEHAAFALEETAPFGQLGLDRLGGVLQPVAGGHVMGLRIDGDAFVPPHGLAGDRIERRQLVDLVAEQLDANRRLVVRRIAPR